VNGMLKPARPVDAVGGSSLKLQVEWRLTCPSAVRVAEGIRAWFDGQLRHCLVDHRRHE
jgi:hypothetical protein